MPETKEIAAAILEDCAAEFEALIRDFKDGGYHMGNEELAARIAHWVSLARRTNRACNAHEQLAEVLRLCEGYLEAIPTDHAPGYPLKQVRAALEAAGKGE